MPEAYTPESRLLAQLLAQRPTPIYSTGQGIAEMLGKAAAGYFVGKDKQAAKERRQSDASDTAKMLAMAMDQGMNPLRAQTMQGQFTPAQQAFPQGTTSAAQMLAGTSAQPAQPAFDPSLTAPMSPQQRVAFAISQTGRTNPEAALAGMSQAYQLANMFKPETFSGTLSPGEQAYMNGKLVASAPKEKETDILSPQAEAQKIRIANATSSNSEPLVQIPDQNNPNQGIFVPRSQAIGKPAFQTPRERMPKMQTYWSDDGSYMQLDSNDPDDQKIIRERGLTSQAPTDSERTAKGFLDRMTAAEKDIQTILDKNPTVLNGLRDRIASKVPLVGNFALSDDYQQALQKVKDWTRAKLRKESGAVIGDKEAMDEFMTYWGEPGDNPNTLEGKRTSRIEARRQLATQAGILGRSTLKDLDTAAPANPSSYSQEDLEHTAKLHGITVDEVKRRLSGAR